MNDELKTRNDELFNLVNDLFEYKQNFSILEIKLIHKIIFHSVEVKDFELFLNLIGFDLTIEKEQELINKLKGVLKQYEK